MTFKEIEKEFDEQFVSKHAFGMESLNNDIEPKEVKSFLKQSFIKYLQNQSDTIEVPLNDKTTTDYWQGWIDGQEQIKLKLQAQIKELKI